MVNQLISNIKINEQMILQALLLLYLVSKSKEWIFHCHRYSCNLRLDKGSSNTRIKMYGKQKIRYQDTDYRLLYDVIKEMTRFSGASWCRKLSLLLNL